MITGRVIKGITGNSSAGAVLSERDTERGAARGAVNITVTPGGGAGIGAGCRVVFGDDTATVTGDGDPSGDITVGVREGVFRVLWKTVGGGAGAAGGVIVTPGGGADALPETDGMVAGEGAARAGHEQLSPVGAVDVLQVQATVPESDGG